MDLLLQDICVYPHIMSIMIWLAMTMTMSHLYLSWIVCTWFMLCIFHLFLSSQVEKHAVQYLKYKVGIYMSSVQCTTRRRRRRIERVFDWLTECWLNVLSLRCGCVFSIIVLCGSPHLHPRTHTHLHPHLHFQSDIKHPCSSPIHSISYQLTVIISSE